MRRCQIVIVERFGTEGGRGGFGVDKEGRAAGGLRIFNIINLYIE